MAATARGLGRPRPARPRSAVIPTRPSSADPQPLGGQPFGARTLFESDVVQIGVVRCGPGHADFRDPGPVSRSSLLFSESAVRVERPGHGVSVSGAGRVTFYNAGESARRFDIGCGGDDHTWLAVQPAVAAPVLAELRPDVYDRVDTPFVEPHGPSDPAAFLVQRLLVAGLTSAQPPDPLEVEETALFLLSHATRTAESFRVSERVREVSGRGRELAERAQTVLARRFTDGCGLGDLAREVGCSHFHLARTFRSYTGQTLHQYRNQLRMTRGLVEVLDGEDDLTALALRLGYSSHSHLTATFRRAYATTPSAVRHSTASAGPRDELLRATVARVGSRS